MTPDIIIGLVVTGLPGFIVGYLMLNKKPPIFRMYLAMLGLALGYLYATGGLEEIGQKFARTVPAVKSLVPEKSEPKPAATPATPSY